MSGWNIRPADVGAVLSSTAAHIGDEEGTEGLTGHIKDIEGHLTDLSTGVRSVPVSIALGEFAGHYFGVMGDMVSQTISGLTGAGDATTAYVNGNHEMALEAQSNAGVVPEPVTQPGGGPNMIR
ncbi:MULTISPECIES: DUF6507 family protein [Nocardiopsis]|uniref:ESX-1 secretion-associated protein n=1 Tax=Nocardiopsis sinuspersici TaxID=501010 RepID=A0A1V3C5A6_9ACTN|nr:MULTISPECIES: DUF6507 family protein [Nocardiopsis]OOC55570.1 hypothetical protein NOSIN_18515 [Nocardiopsis sinuspersici]